MIIDLVDKFADRVIQLLTYKQQKRMKLLEKYITPVFEEFEAVHVAYLESFSTYRNHILNAPGTTWISSLRAMLSRDNLFSANTRSKLNNIARAGFYNVEDPFLRGICYYVNSISNNDPSEDFKQFQRWRKSLSETLVLIETENWEFVLSSFFQNYLSKEEIRSKTKEVTNMYPISRKVSKKDATRRAFALYSLDSIVSDMQNQYDTVCSAYVKLIRTLSK